MSIYLQYQNSTRLTTLSSGIEEEIGFSDSARVQWVKDYLSIGTASSDGLDNWGRILGQSRVVPAGAADTEYLFGFDTGIPPDPIDTGYPQNFEHGNFYEANNNQTTIILNDRAYRLFLKMLYLQFNCNYSLASLNEIIQAFAGDRGECFVNKTNMMEITYTFNFTLEPYEVNLFENTDILPVPAGVALKLVFN